LSTGKTLHWQRHTETKREWIEKDVLKSKTESKQGKLFSYLEKADFSQKLEEIKKVTFNISTKGHLSRR
jgi:hypothetical protein